MQIPFPEKLRPDSVLQGDPKLQQVIVRLSTTLERDHLVRQITRDLQRTQYPNYEKKFESA